MKRSMIIGLVVLLIIGGGTGVYLATRNKDKKTETSNNSSQTSRNADTNSFSPLSTAGVAFEATISSQGSDNSTTTATIKSDGKGNTQYSSGASGQTTEVTITTDAYYSCTAGQCIKYPTGQTGGSGFDPSAYTYTDTQLTGYRSGATHKGKQSCASGTCDTWSVTANGSTSTLYIDSGTKRITQVETVVDGKTSKIVYDYKSVSITVPTNATTLPTTPNYP